MTPEELRERRRKLIDDMRAIIDTADAEKRDLTAEELGEIENRETEISGLDQQVRARETSTALQATLTVDTEQRIMPTGAEQATADTDSDEERSTAFMDYLRTGEVRAQLLDPSSAGGYTVPRGFLAQLVEYRRDFGVMRGLAYSFSTTEGNTIDVPTLTAGGAAAYTDEEGAFNDSDETFGQVTFGAYKMTRIVKVSEELLADSAFDLSGLIARRMGESLALRENEWFISGTGSSEPTGILASSGGAAVGKDTAGSTAITFDEVIDLIHSVAPQYRQNARFVTNDLTVAYLRKIKTGVASDQRYLWQESLQAGQPGTILGYPVHTDPFMPSTLTAGTKTMGFGNFAEYWIRDAGSIGVQRMNERYADTGHVGFRVYARVDGKIVDPNAIKVLRQKP